jgi:CBF/Mak21 family
MIHVPGGAAERSVISASSSPSQKEPQHSETYDPRKREPQHAHAESTCLWELVSHGGRFGLQIVLITSPSVLTQVPLLYHFHPSVSLHARQILTSVQDTATPDLGLNTLSHFLDRFMYKNPKKPKPRGVSAMQPMAAGNDEAGTVRLVRARNMRAIDVLSWAMTCAHLYIAHDILDVFGTVMKIKLTETAVWDALYELEFPVPSSAAPG